MNRPSLSERAVAVALGLIFAGAAGQVLILAGRAVGWW